MQGARASVSHDGSFMTYGLPASEDLVGPRLSAKTLDNLRRWLQQAQNCKGKMWLLNQLRQNTPCSAIGSWDHRSVLLFQVTVPRVRSTGVSPLPFVKDSIPPSEEGFLILSPVSLPFLSLQSFSRLKKQGQPLEPTLHVSFCPVFGLPFSLVSLRNNERVANTCAPRFLSSQSLLKVCGSISRNSVSSCH